MIQDIEAHVAAASRRTLLVVALLAALVVGTSRPASAAPVGWQVSGGWYSSPEDFFLGAGLRFGLASITVIPNAEYLFTDGGSAYTLNVDGTLSIVPLGVGNVYAGGGIGWFTFDPDGGDSNTETVANLIAGFGFKLSKLNAFGQVKYVVTDGNDPFVWSVGIRR